VIGTDVDEAVFYTKLEKESMDCAIRTGTSSLYNSRTYLPECVKKSISCCVSVTEV